jgi:hypothetical protein
LVSWISNGETDIVGVVEVWFEVSRTTRE